LPVGVLSFENESSFAPPSVLPDISPTRGEIGCFRAPHFPVTLEIGEARDNN